MDVTISVNGKFCPQKLYAGKYIFSVEKFDLIAYYV